MKIGGTIFTGDYYIEHNQNGINFLGFEIYPQEEAYKYCIINQIVEDKQKYKIVQLDDNGKYLIVDCVLYLDDFKTVFITYNKIENQTLLNTLKFVKPDDWQIKGTLRNDLKSLELKNINGYDALSQIQKIYECYFSFDNIKKELTVIYPDLNNYQGNYLSEQLNTLTTEYTSDSYELVNRIYPFGKNGLTISSVNGGLDYIENLESNSTPISASVVDEKITNPQTLLEFGRYILNEKCRPKESYKFKIINLSKLDKADYSLKDLKVHSLVKYLDKARKKEVFHIVTKYKEFPFHPEKDEITLSSEITNISSTVSGSVSTLNTNIENSSIRAYNNATAYTDAELTPIKNSINSINQNLNGINQKLSGGKSETIEINGRRYQFTDGILKNVY